MKNKIKSLLVVALLLSLCSFISCVRQNSKPQVKYVASTSWVASFAQMAGVDNVEVIAPANLKHPPEYEITPNDIVKISQADLFMHAGYEAMMKTIANAAEVDKEKIVKITTGNDLENVEKMVNMIAEKAGTQEVAAKRFAEYKKLIESTKSELKERGLLDVPVYVNKNQLPLAKTLELNIAGTFGPAPLTSAQIAEVAEKKYAIIIDNVHNPVAAPAKEVSPDSSIIVWRNFPENTNPNALYNVVKENLEQLKK